MSAPLESSPAEIAAFTGAALAYLVALAEQRKGAPASDFDGIDALLEGVRTTAPEHGCAFESVLETVAAATRKGHDTTGDGWLAYIPGGGLFTAALADFIARTTNRFVTVWEPAPVLAQIEATAVRWLCDLFAYPSEARGVFTTGGSLANFSALVTARHVLLGEDFLAGTLYVSSETHASVAKAALLAGFPRRAVRVVPTTDALRMDSEELEAMIRGDREAGLRPFAVVASAGTTNTGAVDDIEAIGAVAKEHGLWFHVDAAYGGFFQLTERGRSRLAGMGNADSITLDPHKGMFLPYGTGALLVREGQRLREAHEIHGPYLQDLAPEADIPNFSDYSAELSRDARGLRVWMPIMVHGLGAFREALDEKLDLTVHLYAALQETPGIEVGRLRSCRSSRFVRRPNRGATPTPTRQSFSVRSTQADALSFRARRSTDASRSASASSASTPIVTGSTS